MSRLWVVAAIPALLVASMLLAAAPRAHAQGNDIERVVVASEERDSVTFDVAYSYSGDRGDNVFISVVMAQDGKTSPHYAYRPGKVERGRHSAHVQLGIGAGAPALFSTNQIQVAMYVGGQNPFLERSYVYAKTWSRPGAALAPVLQVMGVVTPLPGTLAPIAPSGEPSAAAGEATPLRRILPDGHVELRYPDGTVRERFPGGETVTRPGGTSQTIMYSSAQPPTPPSAPPDTAHALWLEAENKQLLDIIRLLVGSDQASVDHYLSQEGAGLSPYQRVVERTQTVDRLVTP